ncbi:MAG: TonB-dependent receptor, partial [Saprospiraceae bacterium]
SRINEKSAISNQVIQSAELEENQTEKDLPYLLEKLSSVQVQSDAGNGVGYTDIRIRGIDPQQIQFNLNGVPVNDAESSRTYLVDLPDIVNSTDQINVSSGFVTGRSGPGAFGAAIDLFTNTLHFKSFAKIKTRFASYATSAYSLQVNSGLFEDAYNLEVRLSGLKSNGFVDRASSNLKSFSICAVKIKPTYSLRLNLFNGKEITGQSWNGLPFTYFDNDSLFRYNIAGTEKPNTPYDNEVDRYTQTHTQFFYNQIIGKFNLQYTANYTRGIGYYENYKANQNLADFMLLHKDTMTSDIIRQKWLSNHFIFNSIGLERNWNSRLSSYLVFGYSKYIGEHYGKAIWSPLTNVEGLFDNYYLNTGKKSEFSFIARLNKIWNAKLSSLFDLQARKINYGISGTDDIYGSLKVNNKTFLFSPKILLAYEHSKALQFDLSSSYYQREPYREDLLTNVDLKNEQLYAFDFGLKYLKFPLSFKCNFYSMNYFNYLTLNGKLNDTGDPLRINVPKASRQGVELNIEYSFLNKIKLFWSANFSSNKVYNYEKNIAVYTPEFTLIRYEVKNYKSVDLAFSPSMIQSLGLSYIVLNQKQNKSKLEVSLFSKWVGSQFLDISEMETSKLPAYFILNSRIAYQKKFNWLKLESFFQINNLLNTRFSSHGWYSNYKVEGAYELGSNPYEGSIENNNFFNKGLYPQALRNLSFGLDFIF